jgi:DNA-binding transcriptional MerR regulator
VNVTTIPNHTVDRVSDTATVSEVARLAGITVRTLHHYDEIGLLRPSGRTDSGYRLYDRSDIERLQQVLFYRELGVGLDEIAVMLERPGFDRALMLLEQRELLEEQVARLTRMISAVDAAITSEETGIMLTKEEMLEVFGDFDPTEHEDEARERWGDTDAYKESAKRSARYTKDDWKRFAVEQEVVNTRFIAALQGEVPADSPEATDIAEAARLLIDTWFYPLSTEMHVRLAEMYIADPRFTATYENMAEGMAQYVHDAIVANAR